VEVSVIVQGSRAGDKQEESLPEMSHKLEKIRQKNVEKLEQICYNNDVKQMF
jgi:hypothetical protein